jgi:hypothetical protein
MKYSFSLKNSYTYATLISSQLKLDPIILPSIIFRYEVDVRLNNHWTDRVCGENSNQLDLIVQELKEKYTKQSMKS